MTIECPATPLGRAKMMPSSRRAGRQLAIANGKSRVAESLQQRRMALSRWDNEGGAGPFPPYSGVVSGEQRSDPPPARSAELVQLQVRVVALENLLIALLAHASDRQLALAREMATYISPRPGFTRHGLTIHAAAQMVHLVDRSGHFRLS